MRNILPTIILTVLCLVLFAGIYPLAIWGLAQCSSEQGRGQTLQSAGRKVGFANVGQAFSAENYFWPRPSAVNYNAAGSGGSNKGPSNPDYLAAVQARLDTFLVHNPGIRASQVPSELVTASGSGLDPHLSPQGALVQVARIAKVRGLSEGRVRQLVAENTDGPLLGLFGTSTVNVLKLNIALDGK